MANVKCGEPIKTSFQRTPDVDDLATVAEEASVALPATRSDPDMESNPDEAGVRGRTLLNEYLARARAQQEAGKITSERQKAANRANARHSTGPRTPEGKAAVRLNALRHGLLTRDAVLPDEDAEAFEELVNQVRTNLTPVGAIEEFLVDRVVIAMWRLRRLERAETALFHWRMRGLKADRLAREVRSYEEDILDRMQTAFRDITDKDAHTKASEALARASYERDRDEVLVGRAIEADVKDGDTFAKLTRYERSLERSFHRALDEFRRIQDKRHNRPSSPIFDAITENTEGIE